MQRTIKNNSLMSRVLVGMLSCFLWTAAQAAGPLWTIVPVSGSNPTQTVLENSTATVQYTVQNQSGKPKNLVIQPMSGISQTAPCQLTPKGQAGSSCTLSLAITGSALPESGIHGGPALCQANSDGSPNPNQCYQPSRANILNITRGSSMAIISVNPTTLLFAENSTGDVTVTNNAASPVAAENVAATIPGGSNISVQSKTCGTSLAIGASCTITFASGAQEGPTTIPIAGDNTNTVNVEVTVTSQPVISITGPDQEDRVIDTDGTSIAASSPLEIIVQNDAGSAVAANGINVTDQADCPAVVVDNSDCNSVAPGATCTLSLTSATPYVPCTITISGSNTANSPTTPIAFFRVGGIVFEEGGGYGKVVTEPLDDPNERQSQWSSSFNNVGTDLNDGEQNTTNIIMNDAGCTTVGNCAAFRCRNISANWYLPARNELSTVRGALCSNAAIPCNFGGFSNALYWSSSQGNDNNAWSLDIPSGLGFNGGKSEDRPVRCVRAFTP